MVIDRWSPTGCICVDCDTAQRMDLIRGSDTDYISVIDECIARTALYRAAGDIGNLKHEARCIAVITELASRTEIISTQTVPGIPNVISICGVPIDDAIARICNYPELKQKML